MRETLLDSWGKAYKKIYLRIKSGPFSALVIPSRLTSASLTKIRAIIYLTHSPTGLEACYCVRDITNLSYSFGAE